MDQAEREQRRQEIADKIRHEQERLGLSGPLPAFLNLFTDYMVDTDERLQDLREEIANLRSTFVEHKHYVTPGGETHAEKLDRLEKNQQKLHKRVKEIRDRQSRQGMSEQIDG